MAEEFRASAEKQLQFLVPTWQLTATFKLQFQGTE